MGIKKRYIPIVLALILSVAAVELALIVRAGVQPSFNVGMVTFTMDDGHKGQYTYGFPILKARGIPANVYIIQDRIENPYYVTVEELREMVAAGWEVGGHGEFPLTEMSDEQLEAEVKASKEVLQNKGFNPRSFAYPLGKYDDRVVSVVKKYYETALHVSSTGLPYTAAELSADGDKPWTQFGRYHILADLNKVYQYIDQAVAEKSWMIFFFHDVDEDGTINGGYGGCNLAEIADYVKAKMDLGVLKAVTFSEGWDIWKGEEQINPPPQGTLNCDATYEGTSVKAGYEIYYNNFFVTSGTTPTSVQLIPGNYTVKGTYLGLQIEKTATIEPEETTYLTLEFTGPLPPTLLLNPSFEVWTNGKPDHWNIDWNRPSIKVAQSTDVYEGQYAVDVSSNLLYNGINQKRTLTELGVSVGEKVTIKGMLKNVIGVQKARVVIRFYDAAGSQIGYGAYQQVSLTDNSWSESKVTVVIPAGTHSIQIQINPTAWAPGFTQGTFRADAVYFTK
jgi:peptidoglycan/xylan/chitin deacetylase (PgdA/CDA1 family)